MRADVSYIDADAQVPTCRIAPRQTSLHNKVQYNDDENAVLVCVSGPCVEIRPSCLELEALEAHVHWPGHLPALAMGVARERQTRHEASYQPTELVTQRISCEVHPAGIAYTGAGFATLWCVCNAKLQTNQPKTLPTTNRVFGTTLNIWLSARVPPSNCHTTDDSTGVHRSEHVL
jgi:hypothetical protein